MRARASSVIGSAELRLVALPNFNTVVRFKSQTQTPLSSVDSRIATILQGLPQRTASFTWLLTLRNHTLGCYTWAVVARSFGPQSVSRNVGPCSCPSRYVKTQGGLRSTCQVDCDDAADSNRLIFQPQAAAKLPIIMSLLSESTLSSPASH